MGERRKLHRSWANIGTPADLAALDGMLERETAIAPATNSPT
jgi:hypothetical protein